MLGLPLGTVKTLVFRAKHMLKERIAPALQARTVRGEASDAL
jgi:DNA-directed RNA polymerase specialized sigma24 family protein